MKIKKLHSRSGFTMIELLVVATIMILLTTIGLVSYQNAMRKARNGKRATDIEMVRSALVLYRTDIGTYPVTNNFTTMVTTLVNQGNLSTSSITDPKNTAPYTYTYTSAGTTFTACYTTEPSTDPGSTKCVNNP